MFGDAKRLVVSDERFLRHSYGIALAAVTRGARDLGLKSQPFPLRQPRRYGLSRQFRAGVVLELGLAAEPPIQLVVEAHVQRGDGQILRIAERWTNCNTNSAAARGVGYTTGMKTAISIPDAIFDEAERMARRMKRSRSEFYSRAVADYLARHAPDRVTEAMDRTLATLGNGVDEFVASASRRVLERSEW